MPSGQYALRFFGLYDYASEYYNNQAHLENAMPITIFAPNIVTHIDASLDPGGIITGQLKVANEGYLSAPLAGIELLEADTGLPIRGAETRNGYYEVHGIQTGQYKLRFSTLTLDANGIGSKPTTKRAHLRTLFV